MTDLAWRDHPAWQDTVIVPPAKVALREPIGAERSVESYRRQLPTRWVIATLLVLGACGFALFFFFVGNLKLTQMNGLGLVSVLPVAAIAGVVLIALAFMGGLTLPRAYPAALGPLLVSLVICLDGITALAEPAPRFRPPTRSPDSSSTSVRPDIRRPGWPPTSAGRASSC